MPLGRFKQTRRELRLNGTHQFLVCADDVHFLGKNINTVKRNTKAFILVTSREIGLEVNSETNACLCLVTRMQD